MSVKSKSKVKENSLRTCVLLTKYGTTIVVEKHVGGQRPFYFVSVDVLHWGFLFLFALVTLHGFVRFGGFNFGCSQSS